MRENRFVMTLDQLAATKQTPQLTGTADLLHSDTASDPALGIGIGLNIFSAIDPLCNPGYGISYLWPLLPVPGL